MSKLASSDQTELDRKLGVCALPFHTLSESQLALLSDGHEDDVANLLAELGVRQFFFPSPDHTALGLIERGITDSAQVIENVERAPAMGHPLAASELVDPQAQGVEIIEELHGLGLLVEGEIRLEETPEGLTKRAKIRFQPREGLISKLINRVTVDLDLAKILKGD